jgi:ParB-like chromosome segregation protein Spo0J
LRRADLDALKHSIAQFGLLKPFEVAELPERVDFFYGGKGKYVVIDGQRRYFAVRELLRLPTEDEERKERDNLRTNSGHERVNKVEMQAQDQFDRLSIRDYVLVPCLVYPYTTFLQMVRHTIEDKRFSLKPSKEDLELVEKMRQEGLEDIGAEDLGRLWETRSKIEEERRAIEKTLQEIRSRVQEEKSRA